MTFENVVARVVLSSSDTSTCIIGKLFPECQHGCESSSFFNRFWIIGNMHVWHLLVSQSKYSANCLVNCY